MSERQEDRHADEPTRKVAIRASVPALLLSIGLASVYAYNNAIISEQQSGALMLLGFCALMYSGTYIGEALLRFRLWWHFRGMP
jgi:hypothetical protein